MKLTTLATCNLNQWALDFEGNLNRIRRSIQIAKERGARYRLGPELEIPGYGCEDAFLEGDTLRHSWECLAELLKDGSTDGILCDIGMPVMHKNARYNCRIFALNGQILLIRPKLILAGDGNYREMRWFTPWQFERQTEQFALPRMIQAITGQTHVPIGDAAVSTRDTVVAAETCEELFAPLSPHVYLGLDGVEIIANGSGSHHELRKLNKRIDLIQNGTAKSGGIYLYANQQGCDGGRLYYDGCALIAINGKVVAQGSQFSPHDVEVVTATVDLEEVRAYRGSTNSRMQQAGRSAPVPRILADFDLTSNDTALRPTPTQPVRYHTPEEEIALGPACWLWDYLRRSGTAGFFLPLSGGADSSSVAAIVGSMCQIVVAEAHAGNEQVLADMRRILGKSPDSHYIPATAAELANQILHTCYMGTRNSSRQTRSRAKRLAAEIGARHLNVNIDTLATALKRLFTRLTGQKPEFRANGGSEIENVALQNIQARLRMVLGYMLAQLLPWSLGRSGSLLVLGTSNVDEGLRGYMTKYDCSSADINPIGSISKLDLKGFLSWASVNLGYKTLRVIEAAPPSAELEPRTADYQQLDEDDMGMTYAELSQFGRLRQIQRSGPIAMFEQLRHKWPQHSAQEVADKVKRFFFYYSINRHKMTVLTPAYHAEAYSPDDNRFDLRQFLYNARWTWQFRQIDKAVKRIETELANQEMMAETSVDDPKSDSEQ